jgi:hypothetical protein
MTPIQLLPVMLATREAVKAPDSSMPSIAMLTTPARSHRTPERAPNVIGTARYTVVCRIPTRLMDLPAAAQVRKPKTNAIMTMVRRIAHLAPTALVNWRAPQKASTPAIR